MCAPIHFFWTPFTPPICGFMNFYRFHNTRRRRSLAKPISNNFILDFQSPLFNPTLYCVATSDHRTFCH